MFDVSYELWYRYLINREHGIKRSLTNTLMTSVIYLFFYQISVLGNKLLLIKNN